MLFAKRELKTFLLILIAAGFGLLSFLLTDNHANKKSFKVEVPKYNLSANVVVTPSPMAETVIRSPDGKKTLIIKKQESISLTSYSFYTSDVQTAEKIPIFIQTKKSNQSISAPFNTWSPDDNNLFLIEETSKGKDYLVFHASGKPFTDDSEYINITELFKQKLPEYVLEDVTGWAAPDLLIVNTKTSEGVGRSFWFEITSLSFIQLENYFK
ncbi:hypothetical protein HY358_01650 [Candidatus Roizmanbacteria bacterium]|nr:hypothetical protein [Candidatus Roizmanbacteria bacterium]